MKVWLVAAIATLVVFLVTLAVWRHLDRRSDARAWAKLKEAGSDIPGVFDPATLRELPEPAQRYFRYMIQPGTPLYTVAEITMTGELATGSRDSHHYNPMRAKQLLAPPHGLIWQVATGPISGSDGFLPARSWTRFWLYALLPVVRVSNADHHRSAFGRVVAEAAFWVPASLLPGEQVRWEAIDGNRARAIVKAGAFEQAVEITVAEDGAPSRVLIQRWSNENPGKQYREQPFGGELSDFRNFSGFLLPTRVEGGNHFGTDDYFPFYKAQVTDLHFPGSSAKP